MSTPIRTDGDTRQFVADLADQSSYLLDGAFTGSGTPDGIQIRSDRRVRGTRNARAKGCRTFGLSSLAVSTGFRSHSATAASSRILAIHSSNGILAASAAWVHRSLRLASRLMTTFVGVPFCGSLPDS